MPIEKINLQLILDGCRQGNRNSQRKLYEHFYGYAMKVCLRYAKNREEAVEILNDAFLKVFHKLDQFDQNNAFIPWLRRILINSAIDYHRAYHKYPANLVLDPSKQQDNCETPLPRLSEEEDILPILRELSPMYRTVFNLFVMEGYKHREIAEMLNISVSTSRSNFLRAKEKLRKIMQKKRSKMIKTS